MGPEAEEIATFYAKYVGSEYVNNPIFKRNFFQDWKEVLKKDKADGKKIKSLEKCDFSKIKDHLDEINFEKKSRSREQKQMNKLEKDEEEMKFKTVLVDGEEQANGNFRVEPPGIFIGRGCNPKLGKIKTRVQPKDVILNLDKKAKIPKPPKSYGNQRYKVAHDPCAIWIASWIESINNKRKYVFLAQSSKFKKESDQNKFDLAKKLAKYFPEINKKNEKNMRSRDIKEKQVATAVYLIDNLALRVGNEKGAGETDTVGVSSLRVEHLKFPKVKNEIELDFLGKDSIRYNRKVVVSDQAYKNLKDFTRSKNKNQQLFDKISSKEINDYLKNLIPGLAITAKVFRTAKASKLYQEELDKIKGKKKDATVLINNMSKANAAVAILCNHQKKISTSFDKQIEKIDSDIAKKKEDIKELKRVKNPTDAKKRVLANAQKRLLELKARRVAKIDMKDVAVSTSKANYIDPRITVAFAKKNKIWSDVDKNKLFNKASQQKFEWAFDTPKDWKF